MSSDKWQIGLDADVDEDEKTQLLGSYRRYKLTERPDELLEMPEPTEALENTTVETAAPPQADRLPLWAMGLLGGLGLLGGMLSAIAVLWLLL